MHRIFLTVITLSQLFGALLAFSTFDAAMLQSPLTGLKILQLIVMLTYLAGMIGSVLIWASKPTGLWLSFIHQLMLVQLFAIPGSYFWVLGDALGLGAAVEISTIDNTINTKFSMFFSFGTNTLLEALNPVVGTNYIGINIFALICANYLIRLQKRQIFAVADGR